MVFVVAAVALGAAGWYWWRRLTAARHEAAARARGAAPADVTGWSHARLREVVAVLFEYEGSRVEPRRADTGVDLALMTAHEARPRVLVRCQCASEGPAEAKAVRTFFGTTVMEGVAEAWFVSAAGFAPEARQFARGHRLKLISGEDLQRRLQTLPVEVLRRAIMPRR